MALILRTNWYFNSMKTLIQISILIETSAPECCFFGLAARYFGVTYAQKQVIFDFEAKQHNLGQIHFSAIVEFRAR